MRCRTLAKAYAGPAVLETLGKRDSHLRIKGGVALEVKSRRNCWLSYSNESMQIADAYVPGMESRLYDYCIPVA